MSPIPPPATDRSTVCPHCGTPRTHRAQPRVKLRCGACGGRFLVPPHGDETGLADSPPADPPPESSPESRQDPDPATGAVEPAPAGTTGPEVVVATETKLARQDPHPTGTTPPPARPDGEPSDPGEEESDDPPSGPTAASPGELGRARRASSRRPLLRGRS